MTMKLSDVAPYEARIVAVAEQLSDVLADGQSARAGPLRLDASFLYAARELLAALDGPTSARSYCVELTEEQIRAYLNFSPDFLDEAKAMLLDFIERTESAPST